MEEEDIIHENAEEEDEIQVEEEDNEEPEPEDDFTEEEPEPESEEETIEEEEDDDEFDGSKAKPSAKKCSSSPKGKPRIHSVFAAPTKSGKVRCIKKDTRDIRRNLIGYGKESVVAVKHSEKIKPNRSLAGHLRKYKSPRLAVGRSGDRINQSLRTSGGLKKDDFIVNKYGRLVSRKASLSAKRRYERAGSDSKKYLKHGQIKTLNKLSHKIRKGQDVSNGQMALVETLGKRFKSKKMTQKGKDKHKKTLSIIKKKKTKKRSKSPKQRQRVPTIPTTHQTITDDDFYRALMS
jgi:hypothetical protein